ncbi:MAG: type VI secretion system ATPase TssH [Gemmataceae bacterium]
MLKNLAGKMNPLCRTTLENAIKLCGSRTNYSVEVEHWLFNLVESAEGDFPRLLRHYGINSSQVTRELTKALDGLKRGNDRGPNLSPDLSIWMQEAWSLASLEYSDVQVRSGYLLAALLNNRNLAAQLRTSSPELARIPAETLVKDLPAIMAGSSEDTITAPAVAASSAGSIPGDSSVPRPTGASKTPSLDQFTQDLTARAKAGQIDPVVGRDFEIRQVIDILTRRRQNNPILTGEAGVGKTAVVEGFALRIVEGDVPDSLKNVRLLTLDLSLLQAGAGIKGEFENRLKNVIQEVKSSPTPIILFIDEAHTLIGAGGAAGQGDAANLLKPALARGELRTIAATTWAEYKKFFEEDPALKRRFQVVRVGEPDLEKAIRMMRGITGMLEKHHNVRILDEAVEDAVKLSARYLTDRQLPDKSVSLLDTACARVALSQVSTPPAIEDAKREILFADIEIGILNREEAVGAEHKARLAELTTIKQAAQERLTALEHQLAAESQLVQKIRQTRSKLEAHAALNGKTDAPEYLTPEAEAQLKASLAADLAELKKVQGDNPLIQPVVNSGAVAEIVSSWTGIPLGKMVLNEIKTVLNLKDHLAARVIGQDHALAAITQRIQTSRANLADPRRPMGVFLLVGPSGVGKTETAVALADILYGGDRNMVVINMSEYKESAKVSQLIGASAGYVGYGKGGVLTEAVRRKPYSVVLLDEIEKAHVDVQELFYQVFDKGMLQDSSGNEVDFKNTIILLTSNVGTDTVMKLCADPETMPLPEGLAEGLRADLLKAFKPAFLGRCTIVPYYPLGDEVLKRIIHLKLKSIADRVVENHKARFSHDDRLIDAIASRCKEVESGARNVDHILSGTLLPDLAKEVLSRMAEGKPISKIHVGVDTQGSFIYDIQ